MNSRWRVISSLVLALALLSQLGCGGPEALPENESPDEVVEDLMTGTEDVDAAGAETGGAENVDP